MCRLRNCMSTVSFRIRKKRKNESRTGNDLVSPKKELYRVRNIQERRIPAECETSAVQGKLAGSSRTRRGGVYGSWQQPPGCCYASAYSLALYKPWSRSTKTGPCRGRYRVPKRSSSFPRKEGKTHNIHTPCVCVCVYMFELGSFSLSLTGYRAQLSASSTLVFFNGFCANRIEFTAYLPCVCVCVPWMDPCKCSSSWRLYA